MVPFRLRIRHDDTLLETLTLWTSKKIRHASLYSPSLGAYCLHLVVHEDTTTRK